MNCSTESLSEANKNKFEEEVIKEINLIPDLLESQRSKILNNILNRFDLYSKKDLFSSSFISKEVKKETKDVIESSEYITHCFKPDDESFDPEFYINKFQHKNLQLSSAHIKNLKSLHTNIVIPLLKHYSKKLIDLGIITEEEPCALSIINGIIHDNIEFTRAGAVKHSQHRFGKALDFVIKNYDNETVFNEIANGEVEGIKFGVLTHSNGIHITVPYKVGKVNVEGIILRNDRDMFSVEIEIKD